MRKCRMLQAVAGGFATAAFLLLAGVPSQAAPASSQRSSGIRGSELVGRPVRLGDGSVGAWVADVLVDWASGDIRDGTITLYGFKGGKRSVLAVTK